MSVYPRRFIFVLAFLVLLGPLILKALAAHSPGPQRVPVPIPPVAKRPPKKDHTGFPPVPTFKDVAAELGLTVQHISTGEKRFILESMSGGVGLFDCDGDGRQDIVVVNGSTVDRYRAGGDPLVTLYHQDSDLKFTDTSTAAGLTVKGWGMGVAVADFDNDGILDIYVTGFGRNALYKGLGKCKFKDETQQTGVALQGFSTGAAWGDYDRDCFVDLFVS